MKTLFFFRNGSDSSKWLYSQIPCAWLAVWFGAGTIALAAAPPQLRPAVGLIAGGSSIGPGTYAIPCVADWNGDGKKDLLVGYRTADKVALYLNAGTDASPVFTNYTPLQAGGTDIVVPGSGCGAPAPWVCDFDGDGRRDLLVGNGANGTVNFYRNTNTDAAPKLAPAVQLMTGAGVLSVSWRATPCAHDWDEDGLVDLLCGNGDGYIYFFKNTNTAQSPIYAPGVLLQAGGVTLNLGIRAVPRVFDWDGDGLKDLVCSSTTGVFWCRNTNRNNQPILQAPVALKVPVSGLGLQPINTGPRMRLDLVDWNNDGIMDLLLGNADGTVFFYEAYRFAFSGINPTGADSLTLQWNSAPYLKYNLESRVALDAVWETVATNLAAGDRVTSWTGQRDGVLRVFRVQVAP